MTTTSDLAHELGHDDDGRAINNFVRFPDDGLGPFTMHGLLDPRELTPEQADRVRERFAF